MKKSFSFTGIVLSLFLLSSCSFINTDKTNSIVINFGSVNRSRAVSTYTRDDLSYFLVSIDPKVHDDIKVDLAEGQTSAEFSSLEWGSYRFYVSAFNDDGAKIAYGESGNVRVQGLEKISLTIRMKLFNIPDTDGFVKVDGTSITGAESWDPVSKVFISGRTLEIPDLIVCDHEVTRGEFLEIMNIDPSKAVAYDKDGNALTGDDVLNNPVNAVNWYGAIAYCNKLSLENNLTPCYSVNGITDWAALEYSQIPSNTTDANWDAATCSFEANGYRLPTEAEWEWLARGGQNYKYSGSNTVDNVAWYNTNTGITGTRNVKTKSANAYGLYDMSGNVWEWCWDFYETPLKNSYGEEGPASGNVRVLRGGTWGRSETYCTIFSRASASMFTKNSYYGFRVVRKAQ